jgi:alkaline phosphatase D
MVKVTRRRFLATVGSSAFALGARPLAGCGGADADPDAVFPQSVGSGDPKPNSVILWTRVPPVTDGEAVVVQYELARDERFDEVVAAGDLEADGDSDHTVRLKVTELEPHTTYYYRFFARGVASRTGRTRTAPAPDADVAVRFAAVSCQDYVSRYFHGYRLLCEREPELDFVLFLGDYIYEWESGTNLPSEMLDARRTVTLPDGMQIDVEGLPVIAAHTLGDYRALYRQYRSDPDLMRAHEMYPFVAVWDDHEFANDCWADHATDFNDAQGDERSPQRRAAATRAWFEYVPADVDFDAAASFPDDITVYRALRFGRHLELAVTDQRYYRSDHVIPEGPRDALVGKTFENSPFGSRTFARKDGFDTREAGSGATMLGDVQRDWLIAAISSSDATWKLWGSQTVVAQMVLDLTRFDELPELLRHRFYFKLDQWDGYRSERAAILSALAGVDNLVVLSGDIHAFYAAELHVDFDAPADPPAAVEFTVAGLSSAPVQEQISLVVANNAILDALGLGELVPMFDSNLMESGKHYRYASSNTCGVGVVGVDRDAVRVTFHEIDHVRDPAFPEAVRTVDFRVPAGGRAIERI